MKHTIKIAARTASINSLYYNDKRHGKTAEAKEWTVNVCHELMKHADVLKQFRDYFNPKKHVYSVKLKFHIPRIVLITKAGELSSKVHDLSNVEKPLLDILFLPKYHSDNWYDGCLNLNVDDRYLCYLSSAKVPSDTEFSTEIEIEILDLP